MAYYKQLEFTYCWLLNLDHSTLLTYYNYIGSRFGESCNRATEALRSLRERFGQRVPPSFETAASAEQSNFAPYSGKGKKHKLTSWTVKAFCLPSRCATKVPSSVNEREFLVAAGLGETRPLIDRQDLWSIYKTTDRCTRLLVDG